MPEFDTFTTLYREGDEIYHQGWHPIAEWAECKIGSRNHWRVRREQPQDAQVPAIHPFAPWKPPFVYNESGQWIEDQTGQRMLDMRGWGYLTGSGGAALGMPKEEAEKIQDQIGRNIVTCLNDVGTTQAKILQVCTGFMMAGHLASEAIGLLRNALRIGMHTSRMTIEARMPKLEHQLANLSLISNERVVGSADAEALLQAIKFVLDECDWETGDIRIGHSLRKAVRDYKEKYSQP